MSVLWLAWTALAGPAGDPSPDLETVSIQRDATHWRATVNDRTVEVPVPETEQDHAIFRALITSLLLDLEYRPRVPDINPSPPPSPTSPQTPDIAQTPDIELAPDIVRPTEIVQDPEVVQPPRVVQPTNVQPTDVVRRDVVQPPQAIPPIERPRMRPPPIDAALWVAPSVTMHPAMAFGPGVSAGIDVGRRMGGGARFALFSAHNVGVVPELTMAQQQVDGVVWAMVGPTRIAVEGGVAIRSYELGRQVLARHTVPRASLAGSIPLTRGPFLVDPSLVLATDLGITRVGAIGDKRALAPVSARIELRIGLRAEPRAAARTSSGKRAVEE